MSDSDDSSNYSTIHSSSKKSNSTENSKNDLDALEKLVHVSTTTIFDDKCVRRKSNWSKAGKEYKFDGDVFDPETLLRDIPLRSPKLHALLENIDKLDAQDMEKHGTHFKHFIFSDLKSGSFGAKLLASAFLAKNKSLGYQHPTKEDSTVRKLVMLSDAQLMKNAGNNFYLLSSVGVYEKPISVANKKAILKTFNQRPENMKGDLIRFIIMDSGFKEGIDLFDIKYIHIFEPQTTAADQKQVIGRGTRTCGQKGLVFHPTKGWPLYVFNYDIKISEQFQSSFNQSSSAFALYLQAMNLDIRIMQFASDLERATIFGSVDYELNKNIHQFSIDKDQRGGADLNGIELDMLKMSLTKDKPQMFIELRKYVREAFGKYKWDNVKMENQCIEVAKGTGDKAITFSPTQEFLRHYFTPLNPIKGMLIWNSVGTGKTCSAIAAATTAFEPEGYTILWVTRTTLKNDIWKNMFDQVCHERIRMEGIVVPDEQKKRMRLLSKSWSIRPMSYKQFSNLVSKQNSFYKALVKKNGEADPLKKTLLIIDEAHKLYGGADLSSLERPDMVALRNALMNSYAVSGNNSAKLLLMTATPITKDPLELIQLLNLCKPPEQQMPTDFATFSEEYLDETGAFTYDGEKDYLNDIAGYVSYLNREKDARQFAQPIIKDVFVPIANAQSLALIDKYDKKGVARIFNSDVVKLKNKIIETNKALEGDLGDLDTGKFMFLKKRCDPLTGNAQKECKKIVGRNIRNLLLDAKNEARKIKDDVKDIREEIKNTNLFKKDRMMEMNENITANPEQYQQYRSTIYSRLKSCAKNMKDASALNEALTDHPTVLAINTDLQNVEDQKKEIQNDFDTKIVANKNRIKELKNMMKTADKENKNILLAVMKNEQSQMRATKRLDTKILAGDMKFLNKTKKQYIKLKKKFVGKMRKTFKNELKEGLREAKNVKKAEKKLRQTQRKQGEIQEEIKDELVKGLVERYNHIIDADLEQMVNDLEEREEEKQTNREQKEAAKEAAKQAKLREKEAAKQRKLAEKEAIKRQKVADREATKQRKVAERENVRLTKKRDREERKNTTRKRAK